MSDSKIANKMKGELVNSGVITKEGLNYLLNNGTTENDVRSLDNHIDVSEFNNYWNSLMDKIGGMPASPSGLQKKSLYNDAFKDVSKHINSSDFKPIKAISNHLRFIDVLGQYQGQSSTERSTRVSSTSSDKRSSSKRSSKRSSAVRR